MIVKKYIAQRAYVIFKVHQFLRALDCWDSDLKRIIQEFVTKIYSNPDGSFFAEVGVYIDGAGDRNQLYVLLSHTTQQPDPAILHQ